MHSCLKAFLGFVASSLWAPSQTGGGSVGEANPEVLLVEQMAQSRPYLLHTALFLASLGFHYRKLGVTKAIVDDITSICDGPVELCSDSFALFNITADQPLLAHSHFLRNYLSVFQGVWLAA